MPQEYSDWLNANDISLSKFVNSRIRNEIDKEAGKIRAKDLKEDEDNEPEEEPENDKPERTEAQRREDKRILNMLGNIHEPKFGPEYTSKR